MFPNEISDEREKNARPTRRHEFQMTDALTDFFRPKICSAKLFSAKDICSASDHRETVG